MSPALSIFARPPIPGAVKTRLIPALGTRGAAAVYRAFLEDTLEHARQCPSLRPTLSVAGAPDHPAFDGLELPSQRRQQPKAGLGERIAAALDESCREVAAAIAIGSDAPTLPPAYLTRCAEALSETDLAIGPTADGGFYALGARRDAMPALRALLPRVRWSTRFTACDTREGALAAGLRVRWLCPWYDVDDPPDLELLRLHLALAPDAAPATARALATLPGPAS